MSIPKCLNSYVAYIYIKYASYGFHYTKQKIFFTKFVDISEKMRIIGFCMDTKNSSMIPKCGSCPDLTGFRIVVGAKQLKKALQKGNARQVYLAQNADPALTEPLEAMCLQNHIQCFWVRSMQDLGNACGIDVGAAAAAVVD